MSNKYTSQLLTAKAVVCSECSFTTHADTVGEGDGASPELKKGALCIRG
jgi:hypothetical protein